MDQINVRVLRGKDCRDIPLPEKKTLFAAGMDICSSEDTFILPGEWKAVSTGLFMEVPEGYLMDVRSRSGLAFKDGVFVLNSPGLVDADYRGEIKVILANMGSHRFNIRRGDRIAQITFSPVISAELVAADSLSETKRGDKGFGSTGV